MTTPTPSKQRGATLVVALIMLVLLTLFALSAANTSNTNLRIVGNMQERNDAFDAAQLLIETAISSPLFSTNPANALAVPCGTANTLCADVNGDGVSEFTAKLNPAPSCITVKPIKTVELTYTPEDNKCTAGQAQTFGVTGAANTNSLCANSVWELTAEVTSASSGAVVATVKQGVGIRISTDDMTTSCL